MKSLYARLPVLLLYSLLVSVMPLPALANDASPFEIEVDDLQDWSRVRTHTDSLALQVTRDAADPTVVTRIGSSGAYLTYRTAGPLRSFTVYAAYHATGKSFDHPNFYVSSDGRSYRKITPETYIEGNRVTYEAQGFPSGAHDLKIEYTGSDAAHSPSIGKVVLNGPLSVSAGLPTGTVPYGSAVILNRAAPGDTVYYTTDGSDPRTSLTRLHYHSPIEVTDKLLLKATAVNHSGSGRSAAGRVSTFSYVPQSSANAAKPAGLTDPLDDFKRMFSRSNVYVVKDDPSYFDNDTGRVTRTKTAPGFLLYRTEYDIASATFISYFFTGIAAEKHRVYASANGKSYSEVAVKAYPVGEPEQNWQKYAYEAASLPSGTRYLKIELLGSAKSWTPQVAKVMLNQSTASVDLKSTKSDNSLQVELSSATKDARVYYRLNDDPSFRPYEGPVPIQGYQALETYAVRDGMAPSPVRKYTLNYGANIEVDRFGQMANAHFSGKAAGEEELAADAVKDAAYYGGLNPPADRDRYGGLAGSASKYGLKGTGYFAIDQLGSRKVMKTPDGNLFFSLGVNGLTAHETYTMVKGREDKFESLPSYPGEYKPAYLGRDNFSFYLANKYRKSGVFPTEHSLYSEAVDRLRRWGFNSVGAYSPERYGPKGNLPYVKMLPLESMSWAKIDSISIFDIFAPDAEAKIDKAFKNTLVPSKNDPMLIGYFIGNEFDYHKFYTHVPKLAAGKAAIKGRLVQTLREKYGSIKAFNDSWRTNFKTFDELKEAELPLLTSTAWRDMDGFFQTYLDTFFGTVSKIYRKYDPNHLLLGDRWIVTPFHNEKMRGMMAAAEGKYTDVISINYYTYKLETDLLKDVYEKSGGKPILLSEFGYGTAEQGLAPLMPNAASDQNDRGLRYRNYVEGAASLDYVVGAHVFNYVDQAGLGRYWQGIWGEHYNSGLVNVADRPYYAYLNGIMATNNDIYKVMLGERPKFYYDFSKK